MTTPHLVSCVLDLLGRGDPNPDRHRTINAASITAIMDRLYFGDFHIFEQLSTGPGGDRINLIGRKGPAEAAPVWLVAQTGLGAPPVPALWPGLDGNPVVPRRLPGPDRLSAFGAQSGRVDLMAKILAASRIPAARLARPIHIAALSGEEGLGSGAPLLFPDGTARATGTALVHGPTGGHLWSSHPGCLLLQLRVTRRTRHRRMPPHGGFWQLHLTETSGHVNLGRPGPDALELARMALDAMRARGEIRVLAIEAGETGCRRPAHATLQVATLDPEPPILDSVAPGLVVTAIPDGAVVPLPIDAVLAGWLAARDAGVAAIAAAPGLVRPVASRAGPLTGSDAITTGRLASERDGLHGLIAIWTGPGADADALIDRFTEAAMAAIASDDELDLDLDLLSARPAWQGPTPGAPLHTIAVAASQAAGLPTTFERGLASTDAGLFTQLGVEALVFGPTGPIDALYHDREAIEVAQLAAATRFYEATLEALCAPR
jgi:acetylornithine deacetylase/succinyl-diaminopimelate desuccinylase-like protein